MTRLSSLLGSENNQTTMKQFKIYKVYKKENENKFSLTIPENSIILKFEVYRRLCNKKYQLVFDFLVESEIGITTNKTLHYELFCLGSDKEISDNLEYQYSQGNFIICLDKSKVE